MLSQPKRLALLVHLAVANPGGFLRRDNLLALFWPELDASRARGALRQALTFLRRELGGEVVRTRGAEEVGVDPDHFWCDVVAFDDTLRTGALERALELYGGDFLTGFHIPGCVEFEHWLEEERSRLRDRAAVAVLKLADQAEAGGSLVEAVHWARRALALKADDERTLHQLMALLDRAGDRAAALREYRIFAKQLADRHQAAPSPETQALAARIRTRQDARSLAALPPRDGGIPSSAAPEFGSSSPHPIRRISPRPARLPGLMLIVVLVTVSAVYAAIRTFGISVFGALGATHATVQRDRLVVADFRNRTADPTLGHAVAEAVRIDLAQSPVLRLLDGAAVAAVLRRMGRDPASVLDPFLAREIAEREGAKAYVTGEIASLDAAYVLSAKVISTATDETLIAMRENASDAARLIEAADQLSATLRERLGESLKTIRASPPLEKVTTASLDALRRYTRAVQAFDRADYARAVTLLEDAIALDSTFAMAYRKLAPALGNMGAGRARMIAAARKAFQYRDRLPLKERYLAEASFYDYAEPDRAMEAAAYQSVLESDPDDVVALSNLAELYHNTRRYPESEDLYLRAIALTDVAVLYRFAISAQVAQGKFSAARATLKQFAQRLPGTPDLRSVRARFAATEHAFDAAAMHFDSLLRAEPSPNWRVAALDGLANVALVRGRLAEAERHRRDAMAANEARGALGVYLSGAADLASIDLRYRNHGGEALRKVDEALRRHPLSTILASDRPYTEIAHFYARIGQVEVARQLMAEYEREVDETFRQAVAGRHRATGAIAMAEGRLLDAVKAFRSFREAATGQLSGLSDLAEAYDRLGKIDSAVAYYERLATTPVLGLPEGRSGLGLTYRRLGELYETLGDRGRAFASYRKLVELWQEADPELQPGVQAARATLALLGSRSPKSDYRQLKVRRGR